jgi:exosome complex component RRP41
LKCAPAKTRKKDQVMLPNFHILIEPLNVPYEDEFVAVENDDILSALNMQEENIKQGKEREQKNHQQQKEQKDEQSDENTDESEDESENESEDEDESEDESEDASQEEFLKTSVDDEYTPFVNETDSESSESDDSNEECTKEVEKNLRNKLSQRRKIYFL